MASSSFLPTFPANLSQPSQPPPSPPPPHLRITSLLGGPVLPVHGLNLPKIFKLLSALSQHSVESPPPPLPPHSAPYCVLPELDQRELADLEVGRAYRLPFL